MPLDRTTPEPISQKRADELARVVEGFLAGVNNDQSGGDQYMVNIHTETETLKQDGTGAESEIEDRGHVVSIKLKNRRNGLKITPNTSIPNWHGEQMDNGVAVDMLLECE